MIHVRGRRAGQLLLLALAALTKGGRWGREFTATACELGRDSARRLQLPEDVQQSLFHVYDMWRGKAGEHLDRPGREVAENARRMMEETRVFKTMRTPPTGIEPPDLGALLAKINSATKG